MLIFIVNLTHAIHSAIFGQIKLLIFVRNQIFLPDGSTFHMNISDKKSRYFE